MKYSSDIYEAKVVVYQPREVVKNNINVLQIANLTPQSHKLALYMKEGENKVNRLLSTATNMW